MLFAVAAAPAGLAQVLGAPKPIPAPPIPAPPQLGTPPKVSLPAIVPPPPHPVVGIPDAPEIARLPIPPEAAITPADNFCASVHSLLSVLNLGPASRWSSIVYRKS